jgi:phospholipid transport system transporter-binding protein
MITANGSQLTVQAPMTFAGASDLLSQGISAMVAPESVFDLAAVTEVDSSGLAVVFGWLRAAQAQGKTIRLAHPPKNLLSLAEVYGVAEMLPLA